MKQSGTAAHKLTIFYVGMLLLFLIGLWLFATIGKELETNVVDKAMSLRGRGGLVGAFDSFSESVHHHFTDTIGVLLLQIIVILTVARLVAWFFGKIGQPTVIGEIVAGILLGPSLLGAVWPEAYEVLFPLSALANLELLSQFGLILFMFVIGMELNINDIKPHFSQSMIISHAGIFIPFLLGLLISYMTYKDYAADTTTFLPYGLFIGISMSITAFPVLARIIQERQLGKSHLGMLSISTAAAGDISAWLMLAGVMAITQSGSFLSAIYNFLFLILYLLVIFGLVRPFFKVIGRLYDNQEVVSKTMIGFIFVLLLASAYATELLSMHALFGAFMLGLVMPENVQFRKILTEKVEDVSLTLFLPLFFVSSGLQTKLGLLDSASLWLLTGAFTLIAIIGKFGGTYVAAKFCGERKKASLYLGAFMNTRGLMELVVLAIGRELGILPPVIFTILVMMTLITTFMTTPLLRLIDLFFKRETELENAALQKENSGAVLLSFGRASSGAHLLHATDLLMHRGDEKPSVTALHITVGSDTNLTSSEVYEERAFAPIREESDRRRLPIRTLHHHTFEHPEAEVVRTVNAGGYSFLLVGAGINLSDRKSDRELLYFRKKLQRKLGPISIATPEALLNAHEMLRDKMHYFIEQTQCSVGIFIHRGFKHAGKVLLLMENEGDEELLAYARSLARNNGSVLDVLPETDGLPPTLSMGENRLKAGLPSTINISSYHFMLVSYRYWLRFAGECPSVIEHLPSTIIIHHRNDRSSTLKVAKT